MLKAISSLLLALLSIVPALASPAQAAEGSAYLGVIDAGSSGSRLSIYRLDAKATQAQDVVEATTEIALATFAATPDKAGEEAIAPLLGAARAKLEERGLSATGMRIHVLATGGMRLVAPQASEAIYASIKRAIETQGFAPGHVETIAGEREGLYAWLDVNALLGALGPGRKPLGLVEIGGASVQVAYAGAPAGEPGVVTALFQGETYHVRALSFLGLGATEARKGMMASADAQACYPADLASTTPDLKDIRGAFDGARCEAAFLSVIQGQARASIPRAEIKDVSFIGVGRPLNGVLAEWRLAGNEAGSLGAAALRACATPYGDIAKTYGATPYTQYLCANLVYLATLLFNPAALGLDPDQITAVDRIGTRRPAWTRGAALMLSNAP